MKLLVLLPFLGLSACSKGPASAGEKTTALAPVTPEQSGAIRAAILNGGGGPGQQIVPTEGCEEFLSQRTEFVPGFLEVPEDWEHPDAGPRVKVFYYWRKGADTAAEQRPPVVFFNGGPAQSSHGAVNELADLPFTRHAALVFLDQRGTGCSTPFPAATDAASAARLARWGSEAIVRDAEALRRSLFGERRWRAFGQSYGGLIVHRYLELAPEGLDRAIAHGSSIMGDPIQWLTERLRSQNRVGATYFMQYPADRAALAKLRALIPATSCWTSGENKACGPAVLDSLSILLGFRDSWPTLHDWISALQVPDGTVDSAALDSLVSTYVFGVYASGGAGANVISKMEIVPGFSDRESCEAVLKRLEVSGERPLAFEVNECRLLLALETPSEKLLGEIQSRPISLPKIRDNLARGPVRFFLFSGQQDVFVPFATFAEEVKLLGRHVRYESFPRSGHEGFHTEPHVLDAVTGP